MPETPTFAGFGKTDLLLFLMAVIWGVNFSVVKFATELMQPLAFTGLRVMLAAVVLLALAFTRKHKLPSRRDILSLIALGMLGNGIYQIFFVEGISRTRVGNAALVVAATPALIAITSRVRGVDRVNRKVLAGIALSLVGVGIVVLGSAQAADVLNAAQFARWRWSEFKQSRTVRVDRLTFVQNTIENTWTDLAMLDLGSPVTRHA